MRMASTIVKPFAFVHETSHSANAGVQTKSSSKARSYVCDTCSKQFKRTEHLLRHVRAHRRERPFKCRYCPKAFARKDLLTRHEKTLHVQEYVEPEPPPKGGHRNTSVHCQTVASNRTTSTYPPTSGVQINIDGDDKVAEIRPVKDQRPLVPQYHNCPQHGVGVMGETVIAGFSPQSDTLSFPPDINISGSAIQQADNSHASNILAQDSTSNFKADDMNAMSSPQPSEDLTGNASKIPPGQSSVVPSMLDDLHVFDVFNDAPLDQTNFAFDMIDFEFTSDSFACPPAPSTSSTNPDIPLLSSHDMDPTSLTSSNDQVEMNIDLDNAPAPTRATSYKKHSRTKHISIDDTVMVHLLDDLRKNYQIDEKQIKQIPSSQILDNVLRKYFQCFQRHLPVFHVPTFNPATTPAPLLLAICSIGARYTLNQKHAAILRTIATDALSLNRQPKFRGQKSLLEPVWQTQCYMLIVLEAMFGSETADARDGISELGSFVQPYAMRRAMVSSQTQAEQTRSWESWVEYELMKRLLCGIYIASSLNSATYGICPGFASFRDLDFPLPAEESLWEAATSEEWQQLMSARHFSSPVSITAVLKQLVFGDDDIPSNHLYANIGAFAATMVMHGVNIHMYYLAHSLSSIINVNVDPSIGYTMRLSYSTQTERALNRCQDFLRAWQVAHDDSQLASRHEESFIFNCQALLRLSYVRAFSGMQSFNRTTLLYDSKIDIEDAICSYIKTAQYRSELLTQAAEQVMFCFTVPIRAGHMLTRKTAAINWSVEHAVASWDCTLFLSKWIHSVEMQERGQPLKQEEAAIFLNLKEALQDAESPYDERASLAAQVTRAWAMFMDDVWVWEITLRMGQILRQLADAYDLTWKRLRMYDGRIPSLQ